MELPVVTPKDCRIHVKKPIAPRSGFFALEQLAGLLKKNQGPFKETCARPRPFLRPGFQDQVSPYFVALSFGFATRYFFSLISSFSNISS